MIGHARAGQPTWEFLLLGAANSPAWKEESAGRKRSRSGGEADAFLVVKRETTCFCRR
jgi:hypothetical protein